MTRKTFGYMKLHYLKLQSVGEQNLRGSQLVQGVVKGIGWMGEPLEGCRTQAVSRQGTD